ncbi:MAG: NAD(P)H-binding protein [Actinomycetota bacterium]|nr:NAD(P)H-binding protein [Actinomycetota bacterium]
MRIAITGGTGFVGGHLAVRLARDGHQVVAVARGVDRRPWAREVLELPDVSHFRAGLDDADRLRQAFTGCDAVAHCAGINREIGDATYRAVHVDGTGNVVAAAEAAGVRRLSIVSFLRARPHPESPYHDSKWAAEEIVRSSALEWTVLKPGMMYGRGDHMLDHLGKALSTFPIYIGVGNRRVRPLAIDDAVGVLEAALVAGRLPRTTVPVVGPTELSFDDAARLVARVIGKKRLFVRAPIAFHYLLARVTEASMTVPLVARAQVRILEEEVVDATNAPDRLPDDLAPRIAFDEAAIRAGLPERVERFRREDFRRPPARSRARAGT